MADLSELLAAARAERDREVKALKPPIWRPLKRRKAKRLERYLTVLHAVADPVADGLGHEDHDEPHLTVEEWAFIGGVTDG